MNRKSPWQAKRVESVADVSCGIARRLWYGDDDDDDDDNDDNDDDDDDKRDAYPGVTDSAHQKTGAMSSCSFSSNRPIDLLQWRNVRTTGW